MCVTFEIVRLEKDSSKVMKRVTYPQQQRLEKNCPLYAEFDKEVDKGSHKEYLAEVFMGLITFSYSEDKLINTLNSFEAAASGMGCQRHANVVDLSRLDLETSFFMVTTKNVLVQIPKTHPSLYQILAYLTEFAAIKTEDNVVTIYEVAAGVEYLMEPLHPEVYTKLKWLNPYEEHQFEYISEFCWNDEIREYDLELWDRFEVNSAELYAHYKTTCFNPYELLDHYTREPHEWFIVVDDEGTTESIHPYVIVRLMEDIRHALADPLPCMMRPKGLSPPIAYKIRFGTDNQVRDIDFLLKLWNESTLGCPFDMFFQAMMSRYGDSSNDDIYIRSDTEINFTKVSYGCIREYMEKRFQLLYPGGEFDPNRGEVFMTCADQDLSPHTAYNVRFGMSDNTPCEIDFLLSVWKCCTSRYARKLFDDFFRCKMCHYGDRSHSSINDVIYISDTDTDFTKVSYDSIRKYMEARFKHLYPDEYF